MQTGYARAGSNARIFSTRMSCSQLSPRSYTYSNPSLGWKRKSESLRHPLALRATLLAAYCHLRGQEITDNLVDLLIDTVHRIGAKAEERIERELIEDLKRVAGKNNLLFQLAEATLEHPDGIVREVVFPVVDEQTLRDLVREWKATGPVYRQQLRAVIRNSYRSHFRRILPPLLTTLEFRSNNEQHRPVIRALELLKKYVDSKIRTFPPQEDIPIDGVVRGLWQEAIQEKDRMALRALTASPTRSARSKPSASNCVAKRSGW